MKQRPPKSVESLIHRIQTGTDAEAAEAKHALSIVQRAAVIASAKQRKERAAEKAEYKVVDEERLLSEYINSLLEANAHLLPEGELPKEIEALLAPYRPE